MTTTLAAPAYADHFTADARIDDAIVDPFTFADYLPLFDYDGPARPAILGDALVTLARR